MSISIKQITAQPDIPISSNNPGESVLLPGTTVTIFTFPGTGDRDTGGGIKSPIAFRIPAGAQKQTPLKIGIQGKITYPQAWVGLVQPVLVGSLGSNSPIFHGNLEEITLRTRQEDLIVDFKLDVLQYTEPFEKYPCPIPYKLMGDFQWKLICDGNPTFPELLMAKATRLEFHWLQGVAPIGPSVGQTAANETDIDMQGKYSVNLLRYFLPQPSEFQGEANLPTTQILWWFKYILGKISGVQYNSVEGRAGYGVGCCGGSFNLRGFLQTQPTNPSVNSFDLSALLQVAGMLLDPELAKGFRFRWVCETPHGYLQKCIPFGWDTQQPQGVNNPFFLGIGGNQAVLPDPSTNQNCILQTRAWIELQQDGQNAMVLDGTFKAPASSGGSDFTPELGTHERNPFLKAQLSTHRGNGLDSLGGDATTNSCFLNNFFGQTINNSIARVGVYNLFGVNEPRSRKGVDPTVAMPIVPMPPSIRNQISEEVKKRHNSTATQWMFNDASLASRNVFPVLVQGTQWKAGQFNIAVGRGVTLLTYSIDGLSSGSLALNIHVFDHFHDSVEAMALELSKYDCQLSATLQATTDTPCGNYFAKTTQSIFFVRGNLFLDLTFIGVTAVTPEIFNAALEAAVRLDSTYLVPRSVLSQQVRRPCMAFKPSDELKMGQIGAGEMFQITTGKQFKLTMLEPEALADVVMGRSSDGKRLLCTSNSSVSEMDKNVSFLALSKDAIVDVTILSAHPDTYHPGHTVVKVNTV